MLGLTIDGKLVPTSPNLSTMRDAEDVAREMAEAVPGDSE